MQAHACNEKIERPHAGRHALTSPLVGLASTWTRTPSRLAHVHTHWHWQAPRSAATGTTLLAGRTQAAGAGDGPSPRLGRSACQGQLVRLGVGRNRTIGAAA
jgi:hypothetical protein